MSSTRKLSYPTVSVHMHKQNFQLFVSSKDDLSLSDDISKTFKLKFQEIISFYQNETSHTL